MDLATARALKEQVAQEIVRPRLAELWLATRAVRAVGVRRLTQARPGVALGLARGAEPGTYELAVRLQRRTAALDETLQAGIQRVAGPSVQIDYIGTVFKGARAARRAQPGTAAATRPWYQQRQRPLRIGCSCGHVNVTAGTLGAFGTHVASGQAVILSNNHVLANENKARQGDPILQPGAYDGGKRGSDAVAHLLDHVALRPGMNNEVDAAIAALQPGVPFEPTLLTDAPAAWAGLRETPVEPGEPVFKLGRTTGLTRGVVSAIEVDDVVVSYERGELGFDRQTEISSAEQGRPFSSGGDSGSVIFDMQGRAFGLLFAGSDQGGHNDLGVTYANDLRRVAELLGVKLGGPAGVH